MAFKLNNTLGVSKQCIFREVKFSQLLKKTKFKSKIIMKLS